MDEQRKFLGDVEHGLIRDAQGWAIVATGTPKILLRNVAGEWRGESAERNDYVLSYEQAGFSIDIDEERPGNWRPLSFQDLDWGVIEFRCGFNPLYAELPRSGPPFRVLERLDGQKMLTGVHARLIFADLVSLEV